MTSRLAIVHTTRYRYDGTVLSSYNEARLTPQTTAEQLTLESLVTVTPQAHVLRYWDYWGTQVTAFDLHEPHDRLEVVARSLVETNAQEPVRSTVGWPVLAEEAVRDRMAEFLAPSSYAPSEERLSDIVSEVRSRSEPVDAARAAAAAVTEHLEYVSGSTSVHTTAVEAWEEGAGVCQDFAHLTIAILRAAGVPARYVSGYLHPVTDPVPGETVVGESHAWVQAWVGDWMALDPTNMSPVGERHVTVATGRDYADVAPLRGVLTGAARSELEVSVAITRHR